ncbi:Pr6Pr family membrane protein [Microbacterium sp. QXD-8]|uniref:Pr6Pr family membrane protein n=1 Tax=Microbacterium psychrotolerans TaxID=3068321 RepID=A0ABU0YYP7_9MICO|nr:Pr6Pr family membrane protein [Microbacterium sp. QXD-8]MDQ7876873.1 Pr6Pr family membrane protein [Microbacterium sp. QXD-8]
MYWSWFRIVAAITGFSGVVAGFIVNVDRAARQGQGLGDVLANYFSLFTIASTLLGMVTLLIAASWGMRHPGTGREPLGIALALAAVTGPVLLLGLVYNVLLRGLPAPVALGDSVGIAMLDTYAAEVLHVVLPIYFIRDLVLAPRRRGLPWWSLAVLVGYPLSWTTYTMIRGERVASPDGTTAWWYPYPFLDPHGAGGYSSALIYISAILAGFLAIGSAIIVIGRYRERRATRHGAPAARGALPI